MSIKLLESFGNNSTSEIVYKLVEENHVS